MIPAPLRTLFFLLFLALAACGRTSLQEQQVYVFGTRVEVVVVSAEPEQARQAIAAVLQNVKVDIVLTDIPYGRLAGWGAGSRGLLDGGDPVHQLLESLQPVLSGTSVVAVAAAKKDKVAHGCYTRLARFQVGARQIVILRPAQS